MFSTSPVDMRVRVKRMLIATMNNTAAAIIIGMLAAFIVYLLIFAMTHSVANYQMILPPNAGQ